MNRFLGTCLITFTLATGGALDNPLGVSSAAAAFEDERELPKKSKAKGSIRSVRKEFGKLDKILDENDQGDLLNTKKIERSLDKIEKQLKKIEDKDSSWDLTKEKAYFKALKPRLEKASAAAAKAKMESREPDPEATPVKVFAGAPEMKAEKPDWCEAAPIKEKDSWMSGRAYDQIIMRPDSRQLARAAAHACRQPEFDKRQAWSRNWRQAIANQTGADAKLISRFYAVVLKEADGGKLEDENCKKFGGGAKKRAGQAAPSPADKAFADARAVVVGCKGNHVFGGDVYNADFDYWTDRATAPSEVTRVGLILAMIGFSYSEDDLRRERDLGEKVLNNMRNYTIVSTDLARLDKAKLTKELDELGVNEWGRVQAELAFARAQHLGRVYETYFKQMSPAIQELALKTPKEGFAAWEKTYAKHKEGVDLYFDLEEKLAAGNHTAIKGCFDKAHGAFTSYVSGAAKGVKDKDDKLAIMKDAFGATLMKASVICASYEGKSGTAATLYNKGLNRIRNWRGPRLAGYWAMIDRFAELKSKDSSLPLDGERLKLFLFGSGKTPEYLAYENTFNKTGITQSETGQVKSVKKTKDGVKVSFKTVKWKETIWDCKETNRIDRITPEGKIVYRTKCKAKGKRTVSSTVKPYVVPKVMAAGIKKGQMVTANVENKGGKRTGVPTEVYASKKKKKLLSSLGAKL